MIRSLAAVLLTAAPAWAMDPTASAPALPCPAEMRLDAIPEPWADNTATYAGGDIRIVFLDLIEPAAAAFQLAILHPPRDQLGGRQCHLIAPEAFAGFAAIDFAEREASYDPERGLTITMPIRWMVGENDEQGWSLIAININQQTGEVRYQGFD